MALTIALAGCSVLQSAPGNGAFDGELCVASGSGPLSCGPAKVSLSNGRAKVRVSDFIYDLMLEDGQLALMLIHDRTLVDTWSASYSWDYHFLRFIDQERRVFYRVRFTNPHARGEGGHPAQ